MTTGASSRCCQRKVSRRSSGSVTSQNFRVSSPSSTTNTQPWLLPALGARRAASSTRSRISGSTGRVANARTIRRDWTRSANSMPFRLVGAELEEVLGHGPAEGDEAVARLGAQPREHGVHIGVDGLGLQRLVVQVRRQTGRPLHPEGLLVVGALDGEAL